MRRTPALLSLTAAAVLLPAHALATSDPPPSSEAEDTGDFVLQITYEGGFVPEEVAFANTPIVMITADGRLVLQGPTPEIYPGPLVSALVQRTITEAGVEAYLDLAEEHGLLEEREYAGNDQIADAPFTVVRIRVGDDEFVHAAYALGFDDETDADRAELYDFIMAALNPDATAAEAALGTEEPFEFDSYLVSAYENDPAVGSEPEPTVVAWPADAGVRLADAEVCAVVPADGVRGVLTDATQLTWFDDDGVTYRVAAAPRVPGRIC